MFDRPRIAAVASLLAAFVVTAHTASAAEPEWIRQFVTDDARAVAAGPDGAVHVVGWTAGALVGTNKGDDDAYIFTLDGDGNEVWKRQPGTDFHTGTDGMVTDDGNVDIANSVDAFLIKYDHAGRLLWKRQPGTNGSDDATGVTADVADNIHVAGTILSDPDNPHASSGYDVFLIKCGPDGPQ